MLPLIAVFAVGLGLPVGGQTKRKVPQAVLDQAETATRNLGQQVVRGNHAFALQRMYPRWKKRAAKKLQGGEAELERRLDEIPRQMARQGITMLTIMRPPCDVQSRAKKRSSVIIQTS